MADPVQDLRRFSVPADFRGKPAWYAQLWWIVQATLFRPSPRVMYGWRRWLLQRFGASIGVGVKVRSSAQVTYPWKVTIGDWSWIGEEVVLYSLEEIRIGSHVALSHRCSLCAGNHDYTKPDFPYVLDPARTRILIEDETWLANDVFVGPGVTIGRGAVVGARSSVFSSLPAMTICYGNPAKAQRPRLESP